MNKYISIACIVARSNLTYTGEVTSRVIFLGVILFIFLRLWQVTFMETGSMRLGGFTLKEMLWYLMVTEAITLSQPRLSRQIDEDVRSGGLAIKLVRPVFYPFYFLSTALGERWIRFFLNVAVGTVIALCFVGPIKLDTLSIPFLVLSAFFAFTLDSLFQVLIGLFAFWFEDTSGLYLIYSRLTMILGGVIIPVTLFPEWSQPIVRALPFSAMIWGPAGQFVHPDLGSFSELVLRQAITLALLLLALHFVWLQAVSKVSANGG